MTATNMVNIELPREDLRFLAEHVEREVSQLHHELVHTDDRRMHGEIVHDLERLSRIAQQLKRLV